MLVPEIHAGAQFIPKSGAILKSFCLLLGIRASAYLYFGTLNNFAVSKNGMKNETLDHSTRQRESRLSLERIHMKELVKEHMKDLRVLGRNPTHDLRNAGGVLQPVSNNSLRVVGGIGHFQKYHNTLCLFLQNFA